MMIPRLRTHPGVNVRIKGGAKTIIDLIDSRIAQANGPRLVQVTRGCDGLPTQHLLTDLQCASDSVGDSSSTGAGGAGVIQIATPTWNGVTERQFTGTAGRSPVVGVYGAPSVAAALPARYADTRGNLWGESGQYLGSTTPATVADEVRFIDEYWPEDPPGSNPAGGSVKLVSTGSTAACSIGAYSSNGSSSDSTYHAPSFDGGMVGRGTSGVYASSDVFASIEFRCDPTPYGSGRLAGPWIVVHRLTDLAVLGYAAMSSPETGFNWSVSAAPDGLWIAHTVVAISGAGSRVLHRFGWAGGSLVADLGAVVTITNSGLGGPTAWVSGDFIKQVQ